MFNPALRSRKDVLLGAVLEVVGIGFGVAGPYVLKTLVDGLTGGPVTVGWLLLFVGLFVVTWSGGSITGTMRMVYTTRIVDALSRNISQRVLRNHLPTAASNRDGDSGKLLGLMERLAFSVQVVVEGLVWRAVPLVIQVAVCLFVIATLIPAFYSAIMAALLIGYVFATWLGAARHRVHAVETNKASAAVSQIFGDVLRNARRVVLNGALAAELDNIGDRIRDKRTATERMTWSLVGMATLQYGVVGLGLLALLVLGGLDVSRGRMTVGDFVLLQAYAFRLALPLSGFGFILSQTAVSIANIKEALEIAGTDEQLLPKKTIERLAAKVQLDAVSFEYGPDLPGIERVSAQLAAGSFNVIVGPNGSGKSTLAQLIAGVMPPSQGSVRLDGVDLQSIPREDRHHHVMYVPQFIGLFNRSLADNALYPPTTQTEQDLASLLAEWRFYEVGREIDFSIVVGEQGERLSGGQIQKLELARLAGVQVPAIILDESTSSLDPRSEARIIATLRQRYGERTTLILITHRPAVAAKADQVLFMQAGRLVASGRHEDLSLANEDYRRLWSAPELSGA
ncbi:ATP-binding cassette domain-containing protein (plasmid) [Asticcacaulis sp. DW145]|uniref:ABC transporter ATP-binding protein n=1 Tax=Asticcacaulis sp. DW145 TaxID=3095608 RepID=UPI003089A312|nr:ATP-binding cassette domain-containing protein [Asticcacaulis sp. DW145]